MHTFNDRIAILSFSNIKTHIGVIRQLEYISRLMPVTVIGYGDPISASNIQMVSLLNGDETFGQKLRRRIKSHKIIRPPYGIYRKIMLELGKKISSNFYEMLFWFTDDYTDAYHALLASKATIILVNNWNALPVGVKAARKLNVPVVINMEEYAPGHYDHRPDWKTRQFPLIDYILRMYLPVVSLSVTVNQTIANRYYEDYGVRPIVVMNASMVDPSIAFRGTNPQNISLIHHGAALPDRDLGLMIDALALTDERYCLHFMLVGNAEYQDVLRRKAVQISPGRVFFDEPVSPDRIVERISSYDLGFYILPSVSTNHQLALPNKFFEFLNAGLGMCIGPSPEMARLAHQYGVGKVASSFEPAVVADVLNHLTAEMIDEMKHKAIEARKELNADVEMGKLIAGIEKLLIRK